MYEIPFAAGVSVRHSVFKPLLNCTECVYCLPRSATMAVERLPFQGDGYNEGFDSIFV